MKVKECHLCMDIRVKGARGGRQQDSETLELDGWAGTDGLRHFPDHRMWRRS